MLQLRRLSALLTLVLHVFVAGVVSLADARAEAAALVDGAVAHVEAAGRQACAPQHDELTCQLCSLVRLGGVAAPRELLPVVARVLAPSPAASDAVAPESTVRAAGRARAPPLARA